MNAAKSKSALSDPAIFLEQGLELANSDRAELALALVDRALSTHSGDPMWKALSDVILSHSVPKFHGAMLRDQARNRAYDTAIRQLARDRVVLDIGTGSGLLAMMAARAGAKHVYACEANALLAASARKIIAANGLDDRITVFSCHSRDLDRTRHLDGGADLIVSEILADDLVGEGMLESLAHARAELAKPDAVFLPEFASVQMALADFPIQTSAPEMIEGFDLSNFASHITPRTRAHPSDKRITLRSTPTTLFEFSFEGGALPPSHRRERRTVASSGGMVSGVAQWIKLRLAPGVAYENAPGGGRDLHWSINLTPIAPVESANGAQFEIGGWYSGSAFAAWCRPSST
ncbi:MAG: 50S ribosomal protein L11 methyltransferase [Pseudomonadota bacterium]